MKPILTLAAAVVALTLTHQTAHAGPILNLASPNISGAAGTTIGWGFTISSDIHHLTVVNVALLPSPSIGTFGDLLAIRIEAALVFERDLFTVNFVNLEFLLVHLLFLKHNT